MNKIYIDVSNLLTVRFVTGIQRVVRNVLMEFLKTEPEKYCLLAYEYGVRGFLEVDRELFIEVYSGKKEAEKKTRLTRTPPEKIIEKIEKLEAKKKQLNDSCYLEENYTSPEKMKEIQSEISQTESQLEKLYQELDLAL